MSRWKIKLQNKDGRARVALINRQSGVVAGVIDVSWIEYQEICRDLAGAALVAIRESVKVTLLTRLWQDAQRLAEGSVELATQKLLGMGFNQETIDSYADELSNSSTQKLIDLMPRYE